MKAGLDADMGGFKIAASAQVDKSSSASSSKATASQQIIIQKGTLVLQIQKCLSDPNFLDDAFLKDLKSLSA